MNRNEVIDVLTAVAAADRRTVGEADVDVWQAVIGDLPLELALEAVRDHLREQPDTWMQPGHVYQRACKIRKDRDERQGPSPEYQALCDEKAAEDEPLALEAGPRMTAEEARRAIRRDLARFGKRPGTATAEAEQRLRAKAQEQRQAAPPTDMAGADR